MTNLTKMTMRRKTNHVEMKKNERRMNQTQTAALVVAAVGLHTDQNHLRMSKCDTDINYKIEFPKLYY